MSKLHADSRSAPAAWREERSFSDELYEWMRRAPWLALSASAHVLTVLILMAIPWDLLQRKPDVVVASSIQPPLEDPFEDQPVPPPEPLESELVPDDPRLQDDPNLLPPEELVDESTRVSDSDADSPLDSPFEFEGFNPVIGIGPGGGGKLGGRFDGNGRGHGPSGGTEQSLRDGLEWLRAHQSPEGAWDSDGFSAQCGKLGAQTCGDPGEATHDVGMTGLALLAFLGDGHTTREGRYREVVTRGVAWLKSQQDPDSGLIGEKIGHGFLYDHAIATLALCEAYYFSRSPLLKRCAQDAVNYVTLARNPYGAWRYDVPPSGDNDTSVTGWCVFALKSAEEAGLVVDPQAYAGALAWLDEVSDPATGRCGYDSIGSASSRIERVNDHFPSDKGEAMTSVALLCRFFLGQDPETTPIMQKHADLLRSRLPRWDVEGRGIDMYYWYYGSYAMYQMGGARHWDAWNKAMKSAVVESQRRDGDAKGSWDAALDPWGFSGGRVYSTALMTLCLEVYFRYSRVLGARAAGQR